MESNNIIPFPDYDYPGKMDRNRQSLIEHSRDLIDQKVMTAVGSMLERVDDTLFDLADRASNTIEQNLYFDAMREMRIKRNRIRVEFRQKMLELFAAGLRECESRQKSGDEYDLQDLSLIEEDDLEESLAVNNAVTKLSGSCREALFALDKRMGCLLEDPELEKHINPFGPENICNAFRQACQSLESGIEVRLIVFKLFEKYLVTALDEAYRETNCYLVEHDILPEIKTGIRKHPSRPESVRDDYSDEETAVDSGSDVFTALQQLLSTQPGMPAGGVYQGTVPAAFAGVQDGQAGVNVRSQVLSTLTQLQQSGPVALAAHHNIETHTGDGGELNVVRALQANGVITPANAVDAQTIDIVAMMFDYILDDVAVPASIKAELGRLQIPVLKAALLDKSLFSKKQHPVRQLLDRIATAAVGWETESLDELVTRVEKIVGRIINEFDDDLALFAEVLADMDDFLEQQSQESASRQERIARVLQGRDRIEAAKERIREAFAKRMARRPVPDFVAAFLLRHWSEVLLKTYLNEGEQSQTWNQDLKLVDDLIHSLTPRQSIDARRELIAMLPRLLTQLKAGMKLIGLNDAERKVFLTQLAECHTRSVKSVTAGIQTDAEPAAPVLTQTINDQPASDSESENAPAAAPAVEAEVPQTATTQNDADDDVEVDSEAPTVPRSERMSAEVPFREALFYDQQSQTRQSLRGTASDAVHETVIDDSLIEESLETYFSDNETVMTMLNTSELAIEEIELIEENAARIDTTWNNTGDAGKTDTALVAEIEQVNALVPGSWVELTDESGKTLRIRLQWVSESTNMLNFSDRRGCVAVRKSVHGLAMDLQQNRARILDQAPLFERAVGSVFSRLGRLAGRPGAEATPSG